MTCPSFCKDPDCTLLYSEHLNFRVAPSSMPTRGANLEVLRTNIREKRWHRDHAAFRRLHREGFTPPQIEGSALRERQGQTPFDITERKVNIDYNDPT